MERIHYGDGVTKRLLDRVAIDSDTGCWNYTGAISAGKYGSIYYSGKMRKAHRVSWAIFRAEEAGRLDLDHLCRNTKCCNPYHLEPVTRSENLRRSPLMDRNSHKTHCKRGHEFSPENTRVRPITGHRTCIACMDMHRRNWRAKNG
jgi:hypothetical protein